MQHGLIRFGIIFILFQYIQGTILHFNPKRNSENADSDIFRRIYSDSPADKFTELLRARRQNTGGNPEAYPSNLVGDERQYAQVIYSGEGSEVNLIVCKCTLCTLRPNIDTVLIVLGNTKLVIEKR